MESFFIPIFTPHSIQFLLEKIVPNQEYNDGNMYSLSFYFFFVFRTKMTDKTNEINQEEMKNKRRCITKTCTKK